MALRMLEYATAIYRQFGRFPEQIVLYVGRLPLRMKNRMAAPQLLFRCKVADIRALDGERLIAGTRVEDNVIAVLARLGNECEAVRRILRRAHAVSTNSWAEDIFVGEQTYFRNLIGRRETRTCIALLIAVLTASAANPPAGQAANDGVAVAAVFLDIAAVKQATGTDFAGKYTVIEVTLTPKGGKSLDVDPDDFLLRIDSDSDRSGPLDAAQVLGTGGLVLHKEEQHVIGVNRADSAYTGVTSASATASPPMEAIRALKEKMLPLKTTSAPVTGLMFFPIEKKKPKDLNLVYSTPSGKLHISFR